MKSTRLSALGARLLVAVVLAACARGEASDADGGAFRPIGVGDRAPSYAAVTLAGDSVRLGGAAPVTLVNVWATWCESCREEMADLEELHRDLGPRGLRVVAVSVDRASDDAVRRFVAAQGMTFPVVHDAAGEIQRRYAAVGVPSSYLISRDGRILWRLTGNVHGEVATVRAEVEKALRAPVAAAEELSSRISRTSADRAAWRYSSSRSAARPTRRREGARN